ncbi:MAG: CHAD domain-containing protein [Rhizomicrobium sp.]
MELVIRSNDLFCRDSDGEHAFPGIARPVVKAHPARIRRATTPDDAFRAILSDCLSQMTANAESMRAGRSVEGLHQLRIALRRLEVALNAFGEAFHQEWFAELRGRAKRFLQRLGPARDLDVLLTKLLDVPAEEENERGSVLRLMAALDDMREKAWKEARECVGGPAFAAFVEDVTALAQSRLSLAPNPRLRRMARNMLDRQRARALKRGRKARGGGAPLHRFRISLKALRYASEFLGTLYPKRKVQRYLEHLRALQDYLGAVNDLTHVRAAIAWLPQDSDRYAAGLVAGWYRARQKRLLKKASKRWKKFREITPFWI